jgi:hypothetical protein
MEITAEETRLIQKYLDTKDTSILEHVIDFPWGYSVPMIQVAIGILFDLFPKRIACYNSILLEEKVKNKFCPSVFLAWLVGIAGGILFWFYVIRFLIAIF